VSDPSHPTLMQITPIGYVFLAMLLGVVLLRPRLLPGLIAASTLLQAASVINVPVGDAWYGITPYHLAAVAALTMFVARGRRPWGAGGVPATAADRLLWLYMATACAGAFVLPLFFAGTPVFALLDRNGFGTDPVPLALSLSNVVQAANLAIHAVVLGYLYSEAAHDPQHRLAARLAWGLAIGASIAAGLALAERVADATQSGSIAAWFANNPGYAQGQFSRAAGVVRRIALPFSEPSYASAFFAAIAIGSGLVAAFGKRSTAATLALFCATAALLNTLGSTGLAAAALGLSVIVAALLVACLRRSPRARELRLRAAVALTAVVLAAAALTWLLHSPTYAKNAHYVVDNLIFSKVDPSQMHPRAGARLRERSNRHAVQVTQATFGLGAGLGSNRASSYLASLLSNTGLPGVALFLAALIALLRDYFRARPLSDLQWFALGTAAGAVIAAALGIPDLNLPFLWLLLFFAYVARSGKSVADTGAAKIEQHLVDGKRRDRLRGEAAMLDQHRDHVRGG
jgi:hypothetical protein